MTGASLKNILFSMYDEMMNGEIGEGRINDQLLVSVNEYFNPMMKLFGLNTSLNSELEPLMLTFSENNPTNNIITKASLPDYNQLISIDASFVVDSETYTRTCDPLPPNAKTKSMSDGTFLFPRYDIVNENIIIRPTDTQCTLAVGKYFRTLFVIDVEDNTTQIPYNEDSIVGIVDILLKHYGLSLGDNRYQLFAREEEINNQLLKR
jgi:hypothetical protein